MDAIALSELQTVERFNKQQDRIAKDQGYGMTVGALGVSKKYISVLSSFIATKLSKINTHGNSQERPFLRMVEKLDPDVMAFATLSSLLSTIAIGKLMRDSCISIGHAIASELWAQGLLVHDPEVAKRISRAVRRKHGADSYRKQAARSIAKRVGFTQKRWTLPELYIAGGTLLDWTLEALPEVFVKEHVSKTQWFVQITPGAVALAERCVEECIQRRPVFLPTTTPPQPWTGYSSGGYWDERARLRASIVRTNHKATVAAIKGAMHDGTMKPHVDAVTALQNVGFVINERVLEVVKWCYEHEVAVKGIPAKNPTAEPARLSDEDWKDETKQRLQRIRINKIKDHNRSLVSNRVLFAQDVATAELLAHEQSFYTPFNCDWRGRVYAVPHFNFQRDDRVRAMFLFANGMPVGDEGIEALKVHTATCGDFDRVSKRPFNERAQWCNDRLNVIRMIAERPLDKQSRDWWTKANKPFLFLAACFELSAALKAGTKYVTTLPVSFDGSCSGLQHLCAMTRASEGSLVNLTPSLLPQDVYQRVAEIVATRIADELESVPTSASGELARICLKHGIDRKLVKRNVMTYSYSSKMFGMSQQLMEDLMRPLALDVLLGDIKEHPLEQDDDQGRMAAKYLAGHIYAAIETVVQKPALAMAFLQKLARALAHEGKPLSWTTPTGLPWINRYHTTNTKRVELYLSDTRICLNIADGHGKEIDKDRASNGVAPNFVHALDAAHLLLTTNACVAQGITNIATVHDSFGCLAPQAVQFNHIIREELVRMYDEHDVLAEILVAAQRDLTVHNWQRLPDLPAPGPLDLNEVLNAQFAFA